MLNSNSAWGGLTLQHGSRYLVLQSNTAYAAQNVVGLVPGQQYVLWFLVASRPGYGSDEKLSVTMDGVRLFDSMSLPEAFTSYEVEFTASSAAIGVLCFDND